MQNYYQVLGVSQGASQSEIKTAYHKLVMKHHPDRNGGSRESEEITKNLVEAYSHLSDSSKRTSYENKQYSSSPPQKNNYTSGFSNYQYDKPEWQKRNERFTKGRISEDFGGYGRYDSHSHFNNFDIFRNNRNENFSNAPQRGNHVKCILNTSLNELAKGIRKKISLKKWNKCKKCSGTGVHENLYSSCDICSGKGRIFEDTLIEFSIPKLFSKKFAIFQGKGDAGSLATKDGDLIIEINISDEKFEKINEHVFSDAKIDVDVAVEGGEILVETIYGNKKKLFIPPGTIPGEIFILKEYGLKSKNGKGDHFVEISIKKNNKKYRRDSIMGILKNRLNNL